MESLAVRLEEENKLLLKEKVLLFMFMALLATNTATYMLKVELEFLPNIFFN